MGQLRFRVPQIDQYDRRVWETAYITGFEGIPWACETQIADDQFIISRAIDESGKVHIVWPSKSLGNILLTTTSLRLTDEPYHLALELARGTISRLRNQTFEWQRIGLKLSSDFLALAEGALASFLDAVTCRDDDLVRSQFAQAAIDQAAEATADLSAMFSAQAIESRLQQEGRFSTLMGIALAPESSVSKLGESLKSCFNLLSVDLDMAAVESVTGKRNYQHFDQQIDWAGEHGFRVCGGPLVNFRKGSLPKWVSLIDQSFESVLNATCQHIRETVDRYRGRVHVWNVATALNVPGELYWSDEQTLRFAVSIIEAVRHSDQRSPVLLTIDQPWSEYLRDHDEGISPLHFADALIRADLGLSGLALEINLNVWPDGSLPRDPLEIGMLVDRWAQLGLPLMIIVCCPTQSSVDPLALHKRQPVTTWRSPHAIGSEPFIADQLIRLMLAKQSVHAIIWNQTTDQSLHQFPHAGFFDLQGNAKLLASQLAKIRQQILF